MGRILVTGGPVSTKLDAIKRITNGFKGGLMIELAKELYQLGHSVVYCTERGILKNGTIEGFPRIEVLEHDGFDWYQRVVSDVAPDMNAIILGAAVANIMPITPWEGKFPSHNFNPGDVIPIDFTLTPRIIDGVKRIAPKVHLFGFKLLKGVENKELIRAAYDLVLSAGCTAMFANDREDLSQVYAVTKERAVHPMPRTGLASWITQVIKDEYYHTEFDMILKNDPPTLPLPIPAHIEIESTRKKIGQLVKQYENRFHTVEEGLVFGTVACRMSQGFFTTARGKNEVADFAIVRSVDHDNKVVHIYGNEPTDKATLNAPLLDQIFKQHPQVQTILHFHHFLSGLPTYAYAPPGTVRDSIRQLKPDHPNAARTLVYRFFELAYIVRIEIGRKLGIIENNDEITDMELFSRMFGRAERDKLLPDLWEEVEQHSDGKHMLNIHKYASNPFKQQSISFNIKHHGCFLALDKNGKTI